MMRKIIKKIIPDSIIYIYKKYIKYKKVKKDFLYDMNRFIMYSSSKLNLNEKENMRAFLIKEYHAVEKGLTLRYPRPGFGENRIIELVKILRKYENLYGVDKYSQITRATLQEYVMFNNKLQVQDHRAIKVISALQLEEQEEHEDINLGGTTIITKEEVLSAVNFDYSKFVRSRHSIRDFTDEQVSVDLIMEAINDSRYTPSVCNRQGWKVHLITPDNTELKRRFLNVQNGNRGFGEYISSLLVITGKLSSFFEYERNQVFIDGGMFSMNLLLALHSKGLGTCCLNTSYTAERNEEFNNVVKMDEDVVPIMFIAVGNLKKEYKVAVSERKSLDEIVSIL